MERPPQGAGESIFVVSLAVALGVRSEKRPFWKTPLRSNPTLLVAPIVTIALQLAAVYVPFLQRPQR